MYIIETHLGTSDKYPKFFVQVQLTARSVVKGVATQARADADEWPDYFYLLYSDDGLTWETYQDGSGTDVV